MKRTTIKVDDDLDARVRHEAARRGLTLSEWTREALEAHLPGAGESPPGGIRRTFRSTAAGRSGRSDISERMEELLAGLADGHDILAEEEARATEDRESAA
ncbi:CopG family transcriptional regulator [Streptomyces sp. NPDC097619]|uniref:ribbon-helix-helix domain-containing protein n=1 Tax=Streptomyces sp. NPDC097619 TaxID=3157228 RepID=UPI003323AC85